MLSPFEEHRAHVAKIVRIAELLGKTVSYRSPVGITVNMVKPSAVDADCVAVAWVSP